MYDNTDLGVIHYIQPVYGALLSSYNTKVVACLLHKVTLVTLRQKQSSQTLLGARINHQKSYTEINKTISLNMTF